MRQLRPHVHAALSGRTALPDQGTTHALAWRMHAHVSHLVLAVTWKSLPVRACALWQSLCNACGIRFKKERQATETGGRCGYVTQQTQLSSAPAPPRALIPIRRVLGVNRLI